MFDQILFPTDGSDGAEVALAHVLDVAQTYDAKLHVLNVADTTVHSAERIGGEIIDTLEIRGEEIVEEAKEAAAERGVSTVNGVHQGAVPETILGYADEYEIDLVVMPTRGRTGLSRLLMGSVTERVLRSSDMPVLTINPNVAKLRYPYETVLIPTDGSDTANEALEVGIDLANVHDAQLHVLSVVDVTSLGIDVQSEVQVEILSERAENIIDEATKTARNQSVESVVGVVEYESAVHRSINSYVDEHNVDVVVMGTHGRSGLDRYLLGSVAEKIIRTAPVPVLTVPGGADQ